MRAERWRRSRDRARCVRSQDAPRVTAHAASCHAAARRRRARLSARAESVAENRTLSAPGLAELRFEQCVDLLRIRLAAAGLHHLADEESEQRGLAGTI